MQLRDSAGRIAIVSAQVWRKLPFSDNLDPSLLELQESSIDGYLGSNLGGTTGSSSGGGVPGGWSSGGSGSGSSGSGGGMTGGWSSGGSASSGSGSGRSGGFSPEEIEIAKWAMQEMNGAPGWPAEKKLEYVRLLSVSTQVVAG